MGLLEQVLGGMLGGGSAQGGGRTRQGAGGMSPIVMALLALLASRGGGGSGGNILGDLLGGGRTADPRSGGEMGGGGLGGAFGGGMAGGGLGDLLGSILGGQGGLGGGLAGSRGVDASGGSVPRMDPGPVPEGSRSSGDRGLDQVLSDVFGQARPQGATGQSFSEAAQAAPSADPRAQLGDLLGGGLGGLMDLFQQNGRGDVAASWVGTGENRQVSAADLQQALPDDTIEALARMMGRGREDVLTELSRELPETVDRMTPQGRLPRQDEWV